jgi:hypothetical protein
MVAAVIIAGCGGSRELAVNADGRPVLQDAVDGHLDRHWSCGSHKVQFGAHRTTAAHPTVPQDRGYGEVQRVGSSC